VSVRSVPPSFVERPVSEPTDREFALFRDLIQDKCGIHLNPSKRALLHGRLARRIRDRGLSTFTEYYELVADGRDRDELVKMIDRITTNETHFFREPHHFEYLARVIFPQWTLAAAAGERERHVRAWSAGCSTGEEPYSLAMVLLAHFPRSDGWTIDVRATDLSTRVLDVARDATWPATRLGEIPQRFLKAFMLRGTGAQEGKIRAGRELRSVVRVERVNLMDDEYPDEGALDLVFCRNVLIYFQPPQKTHVLERLVGQLAPGGHLFLGHAESVQGLATRVRCVSPTVYVVSDDAGSQPATARRSA
jgi:chemotaxis protein methyltransferase CheR